MKVYKFKQDIKELKLVEIQEYPPILLGYYYLNDIYDRTEKCYISLEKVRVNAKELEWEEIKS